MPRSLVKVIARTICQDKLLQDLVLQETALTADAFADPQHCRDRTYLQEFLRGVVTVVVGHQRVDARFLKDHPDIKTVVKYGVGVDNIDFDACREQGVKILWEQGVNRQFVAEHTLGLILGLSRNISLSDRDMKDHRWLRQGGHSLFGKCVGIIGFGNVGSALAQLLQPFSVQVLVRDIVAKEITLPNCRQVSLDDLLIEADVVSMHVPLTEQTRKMCDRGFFEKTRKGVVFINAARGEIVDEEALLHFLKDGHIAGAGLDVFEEEPTGNRELVTHPKVIATPHIAAHSQESRLAMVSSVCRGLNAASC